MIVIGIDPGPSVSGLVVYDSIERRVLAAHGAAPIEVALDWLGFPAGNIADLVVIEQVESFADGQPHDLLLKDRHAKRFGENILDRFAGIGDGLEAMTAAQIGMDHAALNRPRADDGDLDHEIIEAARPQARQHAHLGPAFDLEDADGVGVTDHVVDGRIFGGKIPQSLFQAAQQLEALVYRRQHPQVLHEALYRVPGAVDGNSHCDLPQPSVQIFR